jgi:hypothetical protein
MAEALEIRPVRTRRDMNAFIRAAFRAQGHNPRWAPALDMEAHEFFDPKHSPFAKENEIECYVALRDGEPVGRIAAILNRAHLAYRKDQTGHFGFIEAIDDPDVFRALTDQAGRFAASRGLTRLMGPFSASINHEVGILFHGFDETHMVRTNYAPPYYARQLEALGFTKAMDMIAFETKTDARIDEKLERIRSADARWKGRGDLKTYGLTYRSWFSSFKRLLALFNDAWSENWGAIPISDAEVAYIAKLMLPVIKPSWIRIAEWQGEPVGIVAQIPNANEAFAQLRGKLLPFGWWRLMNRIHMTGTRSSRIPIAGSVKKWRNSRVGHMAMARMMLESFEIARANRIERVEISWVLETNIHAVQSIELFGARAIRKFRVFERPLQPV